MEFEVERNVDTTTTAVAQPPASSIIEPQFIVYEKSPIVPLMYPTWPSIAGGSAAFLEQGNLSCISGQLRIPYMPPCAWYYPCHHDVSGSAQCSCAIGNQELIGSKLGLMQSHKEVDVMQMESPPSSVQKERPVLATVVPEKDSGTDAAAKGVSESHKEEQVNASAENTAKRQMFPPTASSHEEKSDLHRDKCLPEDLHSACTRPPNKSLSATATATAAAAEARKKRKELTKLKCSQGRRAGLSN